jgi:hypothetical protein
MSTTVFNIDMAVRGYRSDDKDLSQEETGRIAEPAANQDRDFADKAKHGEGPQGDKAYHASHPGCPDQ